MLKKLILTDWRAKLGSIAVAYAIWYVIRAHVEPQLEWRPYIPPATSQPEAARVE